jgi:hypothetical protein
MKTNQEIQNSESTTQKRAGRGSFPWMLLCFIILQSSFCLRAMGQQYSIDWHKIAGGGGTSTGGTYSIGGTIGQHDARSAMAGGSYSMTGGFWSIIAAVHTQGVPNLVIQYLGPNSVEVSWPDTGVYTLQQNSDLITGTWTASSYSIATANGTNSVTITPPTGNLFFRLANP